MKIQVFERTNPFSHTPGISCLIPGTLDTINAYPSKINQEILDVQGPVREWSLFQDLDKGKVFVRGIAENGYFTREWSGAPKESTARLSFGVHKAQNMNLIKTRAAPEEFLPLWFALGQYYLDSNHDTSLLSRKESLLKDVLLAERQHLYQAWKHLFQAGFSGWLIPRAYDEDFHGFAKDPIAEINPHQLLPLGALLIQKMLIEEEENALAILPKLPPELHCGKLVHVTLPSVGGVSLEWSKKEIKKVIIVPSHGQELCLKFPKRIQSFRLSSKEGIFRQTTEQPLKLQKDQSLYIDQFQH